MGGIKRGGAPIRTLKQVAYTPLWTLTGAAALACSSGGERGVAQQTEPVVFQNVSQIEFESATPNQQEWATAVGILMPTSDIKRPNGTCPDKTQVSNACTAVLNTSSNFLCAGEDFATQKEIVNSCTAFMIRNDPDQPAVFATAGHCISTKPDCSDQSVVLKWRRALPNFPGGNPNVLEQHIYQCTRILAHGGETSIVTSPKDWAVFEVDRHVTGGGVTGGPLTPDREALTISASGPVPGGGGTTIGHPVGVPTKIDPEVQIGELSTARGPGTFYAFLDAIEGQSGSPILNESGEVVGILAEAQGPDLVQGTTCHRQCFPPNEGPVTCDPLTGLSSNDPNAYATVGVSIAQLPSQFRNTAEHVMILLDQTGSMTLAGTASGATRWDDAVSAASQWVQLDRLTAGFVERAYSIWTFRDDTAFGGTQTGLKQIWPDANSADCAQFDSATGFCVLPRDTAFDPVQYDALEARLETIRSTQAPIVGPVTPLAHSLCGGLQTLRAIGGQKRIIIESDGGENATALSDACFGDPSGDFGDWSVDLSLRQLADWGMTVDSWQSKVVRRATRLGLELNDAVASPLTALDWFPFDLVWNVDLHFGLDVPSTASALRTSAFASVVPVEGGFRTAALRTSALAAPTAPVASSNGIASPELSLFKNLGQANPKSTFHTYERTTGSVFGVDHPVAGDLDNNGCVDRADLCSMMQDNVWEHRAVAPASQAIQADLNRDGWVNPADLALLTSNWSNGCASPTPAPDFDSAVHGCRADFGRRWLSFEDPLRPWSLGIGSVFLSTTQSAASDLLQSLQVNGCQYAAINSPPFNTSELPSGQRIALDVLLPTQQQNPYWLGDVQLYLTVPGANLNNAWLGFQPLTGLTTGTWHSLSFALPPSVQAALATAHAGAQLQIALNTGNCLAPVRIDHVRVEP